MFRVAGLVSGHQPNPTRLEAAPGLGLCRVAGCAGFFASRMRARESHPFTNINIASDFKHGKPGNPAQIKHWCGLAVFRVLSVRTNRPGNPEQWGLAW